MPDGTLNKRYVRTQTLAPDPVDVFALGQIREFHGLDSLIDARNGGVGAANRPFHKLLAGKFILTVGNE
jgi:hypothetical protein